MMDWVDFKGLAEASGVAKDALHVYFALVIQVMAAIALKCSLGAWRPWLSVLAVELLNELLDIVLTDDVMFQDWQIAAARHDILNTMVLPTALLLLCRFWPGIFLSGDAQSPLDQVARNEAIAVDELSPATSPGDEPEAGDRP